MIDLHFLAQGAARSVRVGRIPAIPRRKVRAFLRAESARMHRDHPMADEVGERRSSTNFMLRKSSIGVRISWERFLVKRQITCQVHRQTVQKEVAGKVRMLSDGAAGPEITSRDLQGGDFRTRFVAAQSFSIGRCEASCDDCSGIRITPLLPMISQLEWSGGSFKLHYVSGPRQSVRSSRRSNERP